MDNATALAEELEDIALQLSSLDPTVTEPDAVEAVIQQVLADYQRLHTAALFYANTGLQDVTEWISNLLYQYHMAIPEAILELLQGGQLFNWIELTAAALRDPQESSILSAIHTELLQDTWPEPIDEDSLTQLLLSLRQTDLSPSSNDTADSTAPVIMDNDSANLTWAADIHPELLNAYLHEAPLQITQAAQLIRLIAQQQATPEQKRQAARLAHTIKGSSSVVGVKALANFTHKLEDLLELNLKPHIAQGLDDTLLQAADCLESLFEHLQEHKALPANYANLLQTIIQWRQTIEETPITADSGTVGEEVSDVSPTTLSSFIAPLPFAPELTEEAVSTPTVVHASHLSVPRDTIQLLFNLAGELISSTSQLLEQTQHLLSSNQQWQHNDEQVRRYLDNLAEVVDQQAVTSHTLEQNPTLTAIDKKDEVELETYNQLHSVSGLLTEAVADTRETIRNTQKNLRQLTDQVYQQQRLHKQLSETVMRTRLVPVQSIVARLERTVRETCRQTGKQASISIEGQELQIDTDILQTLLPAFLHLIRNSIDHGIELPHVREQNGKPAQGHIQLTVEQRGDHLRFTLTDDGQGMNVEAIRERALQTGLIQPQQLLSANEVLQLVLHPGFTTRTEVSDVSGRGIGMDVVKNTIDGLLGSLVLTTVAGQSTSTHIQIPLTMIAINALLMRTAGNLIAIPTSSLTQIHYIAPTNTSFNDEQWSVNYQNQRLPVLHLAQLAGWQAKLPDEKKGYSVIIVTTDINIYALYVDEVLQPREIVVKSLPNWLNIKQSLTGACLLADGTVVPVLDVQRLMRHYEQGALPLDPTLLVSVNKNLPQRDLILIVDDSLSNRKSLSLLIDQLGYQTVTAVDGLEALQQLHKHPIQLVLTDLEMPRMNGLELTQAIRIWPEKRHIPVLMLTSRSTQKHRQLAATAGVDEYLTKPVDRTTLETHLRKWLSANLVA